MSPTPPTLTAFWRETLARQGGPRITKERIEAIRSDGALFVSGRFLAAGHLGAHPYAPGLLIVADNIEIGAERNIGGSDLAVRRIRPRDGAPARRGDSPGDGLCSRRES